MSPRLFLSLSLILLIIFFIMCIALIAGWMGGEEIPATLWFTPFLLIGGVASFYIMYQSKLDNA